MTQLPYPDLRESIGKADAQLLESLSFYNQTTEDPFKHVFRGEDGRATFQKPSSNFFQVIGNKLYRDQAASDDFTIFQKSVARSGAEALASVMENELKAPIAEVDGMLLLPTGLVPMDKASARDAFSTLPPADQLSLEQTGITADSLVYMGINTAQDLADKWSTVVHIQRAHFLIEDFNERSNGVTKVINTVATVGVNMITDPTVWLTLGYAAIPKTTAKTAVTQATKQATRMGFIDTLARDGVFPAIMRNSLIGEKVIAARVLNALAYGTANASIGATVSAGAQSSDITSGLADPSRGYEFSTVGTLLQGSLGALFGDFAIRSAGMRARALTRKAYRASIGEYEHGLVSHYMKAQERLNYRHPDEVMKDVDIGSIEAVEDALKYLYDSVQLKHITDWLEQDETITEIDYESFFRYLERNPTFDELEDFMLNRRWGDEELPDTAYSKLIRDINETEIRVRELGASGATKASREARAHLKALKEQRRVLEEDTLNRTRTSGLYSEFRELEQGAAPLNTLSAAEESSRYAQIITRVAKKANRNRPRALIPGLRKLANKANNVLDDLAATKVSIHYGSALESIIGRLTTLIDHNKHAVDEMLTDSEGVNIRSTYFRDHDFRRRRILPITIALEDYTKGMSAAEVQDVGLRIQRARNTGDVSKLNPQESRLLDLMSAAYDEAGSRAVRTGYLENLLPNYTYLIFDTHASGEQKEIFVDLFVDYMRRGFNPDTPSSPVNINTLERMGHMQYKNGKWVVKGESLEDVPKTVADLPNSIREDYAKALDESLAEDAHDAFIRRSNRHEENLDDPDFAAEASKRRSNPNNTVSRRIEQDFYLSDEMAASGLINYDILDSVNRYTSSTAYNTFRTEAFSELFGEPVNYMRLIKGIGQAAANDPGAKDALARLKRIDSRNAGRTRINDALTIPATAMQDTASAGVAATVGQAIIQTELGGSLVRLAGGARNVTTAVVQFIEAILALDKRTAKDWMTFMEMETNRFVGSSSPFLTEDARNNPILKFTGTLNKVVRIAAGERFFTTLSKNFNFVTTYGKAHRYAKKLDRIAKAADIMNALGRDIPEKTLRRIARDAGVPVGDLLLMRSRGITSRESIDIMRKMLEIDKNALRTPGSFASTIRKLKSAEDRAAARRLDTNLRHMAADDANTFVATPTANTQMTTDHSLTSMMLGFTSFQRSFANGAISRASLAPAWKQIGGLGFLFGTTASVKIAREILYNGESPDTVLEKWEKNPSKELALILGEMPLLGPFNLIPPILMGAGLGSRYGLENLADAPALNIIGRQSDAVRTLWNHIREGGSLEDTPASVSRTIERTVPGANFWYARLIAEMGEGFQEDSDR